MRVQAEVQLYRVGMEPVVQNGPLLVHTNHLPHLLKAGIYGHQVKKGRTVLFNDSWDKRNNNVNIVLFKRLANICHY